MFKETEPAKEKKGKSASFISTKDISNDSTITKGNNSCLLQINDERQHNKPTKISSKMQAKTRRKEDQNNSIINSRESPKNDRQDAVFKVPLPPRTRAKTNKDENGEKFYEDKTIHAATKASEGHEITDHGSELYLKNWTPKLKGKKLLLEGDLLDFG